MLNPCIQCGKERVDSKAWKEKSGASVVTHTLTICPDSTCQRIVNKGIADRQEKSANLIKKKLEAKLAKEKLLVAN